MLRSTTLVWHRHQGGGSTGGGVSFHQPRFHGTLFTLMRYAVRHSRYLEGSQLAMLVAALGNLRDQFGAKQLVLPSVELMHEMSGYDVASLLQGFSAVNSVDDKLRRHIVKNYLRRRSYTLSSFHLMLEAHSSMLGRYRASGGAAMTADEGGHSEQSLLEGIELLLMALERLNPSDEIFFRLDDYHWLEEEETESHCAPLPQSYQKAFQVLRCAQSCAGTPAHTALCHRLLPACQHAPLKDLAEASFTFMGLPQPMLNSFLELVARKILKLAEEPPSAKAALEARHVASLLRVLSRSTGPDSTVSAQDVPIDLVAEAREQLLAWAAEQVETGSPAAMHCFLKSFMALGITDMEVVRPFLQRLSVLSDDGSLAGDFEMVVSFLEVLSSLMDINMAATTTPSNDELRGVQFPHRSHPVSFLAAVKLLVGKLVRTAVVALTSIVLDTPPFLDFLRCLVTLDRHWQRFAEQRKEKPNTSAATPAVATDVTIDIEAQAGMWSPLTPFLLEAVDTAARRMIKTISCTDAVEMFVCLTQLVPRRGSTSLLADRIVNKAKDLTGELAGKVIRALPDYPKRSSFMLHALAPRLAEVVPTMTSDDVVSLLFVAGSLYSDAAAEMNPLEGTELQANLKHFILLHIRELSDLQMITALQACGELKLGYTSAMTDTVSEVIEPTREGSNGDAIGDLLDVKPARRVLDVKLVDMLDGLVAELSIRVSPALVPSLLRAYLSLYPSLSHDLPTASTSRLLLRVSELAVEGRGFAIDSLDSLAASNMVRSLAQLILSLQSHHRSTETVTAADICDRYLIPPEDLQSCVGQLLSRVVEGYKHLSAGTVTSLLGNLGTLTTLFPEHQLAAGLADLCSAVSVHVVGLQHRWAPFRLFEGLVALAGLLTVQPSLALAPEVVRVLKCLLCVSIRVAVKPTKTFTATQRAVLLANVLPQLRQIQQQQGTSVPEIALLTETLERYVKIPATPDL